MAEEEKSEWLNCLVIYCARGTDGGEKLMVEGLGIIPVPWLKGLAREKVEPLSGGVVCGSSFCIELYRRGVSNGCSCSS